MAVGPIWPRPHDCASIGRQVGPSIAVDIGTLLPMSPTEQRVSPALGGFVRQPDDRVGAATRRAVHQHLAFGLTGPRRAGHEVDDKVLSDVTGELNAFLKNARGAIAAAA